MTQFTTAMKMLLEEANPVELVKVLSDLYIRAVMQMVIKKRKIRPTPNPILVDEESRYSKEISQEFKALLSEEVKALDLFSKPDLPMNYKNAICEWKEKNTVCEWKIKDTVFLTERGRKNLNFAKNFLLESLIDQWYFKHLQEKRYDVAVDTLKITLNSEKIEHKLKSYVQRIVIGVEELARTDAAQLSELISILQITTRALNNPTIDNANACVEKSLTLKKQMTGANTPTPYVLFGSSSRQRPIQRKELEALEALGNEISASLSPVKRRSCLGWR